MPLVGYLDGNCKLCGAYSKGVNYKVYGVCLACAIKEGLDRPARVCRPPGRLHCAPGAESRESESAESGNTIREDSMSHHGEGPYPGGDKSPEQQAQEREARRRQLDEVARLKEEYSHATKAMFTEFARMYREIEDMGVDPVLLRKAWLP